MYEYKISRDKNILKKTKIPRHTIDMSTSSPMSCTSGIFHNGPRNSPP